MRFFCCLTTRKLGRERKKLSSQFPRGQTAKIAHKTPENTCYEGYSEREADDFSGFRFNFFSQRGKQNWKRLLLSSRLSGGEPANLCSIFLICLQKVRIPWKAICTSLPFWAIVVAHVTYMWGHYTMLSDLPLYFSQRLHFDIEGVSLL